MANCPNCGNPVADGVKFCASCGTPIQNLVNTGICSICGNTLAPGAKFCPVCGTKTPEADAPAAPEPELDRNPTMDSVDVPEIDYSE
ncbi:MAG: zinc ribbon domain-containing protein, partial [Ruminococcus sp.]|nr:zinc ribbon domain-containing protein [Ruminococcus sp.]